MANKIAAVLFYGFFGFAAFFAVIVYLAGRDGRDNIEGPQSCATKAEALAAVLDSGVMAPKRKHETQMFLETDRGIEVTLVFAGGQTLLYSVAPDCTVRYA